MNTYDNQQIESFTCDSSSCCSRCGQHKCCCHNSKRPAVFYNYDDDCPDGNQQPWWCESGERDRSCGPSKGRTPRPCRESLSELVASVATIENSIAESINAQVRILRKDNFSPEQYIAQTKKLENLLKLAIKKEFLLLLILEEAAGACDGCSCAKA